MPRRTLPAELIFASLIAFLLASSSIAYFQGSAPEQETAWVCPMHPDYTMDVTGKCPRCGMDLLRAAPFDVRDYQFEFRTVPAAVRPGQKTKMQFKIFHPGTGKQVTKFEAVH